MVIGNRIRCGSQKVPRRSSFTPLVHSTASRFLQLPGPCLPPDSIAVPSIPSCDDEWGQVGFQQPSVIDQLHVPVLAMQLLLPMKYALLGCFLELTILLLHEKALSPKSPKSGLRLS